MAGSPRDVRETHRGAHCERATTASAGVVDERAGSGGGVINRWLKRYNKWVYSPARWYCVELDAARDADLFYAEMRGTINFIHTIQREFGL